METRIGKVTHFYNHINVAVISLADELKVGDQICIVGRVTDFEQPVGSMEIDHRKVQRASAGMIVAVKVIEPVRSGDEVFRLLSPQNG